jgi:hypothetical protein
MWSENKLEDIFVKVKETKAETPTRTSARIAAKALSEGFSDDETEKVFITALLSIFILFTLRRFLFCVTYSIFRTSVCGIAFLRING